MLNGATGPWFLLVDEDREALEALRQSARAEAGRQKPELTGPFKIPSSAVRLLPHVKPGDGPSPVSAGRWPDEAPLVSTNSAPRFWLREGARGIDREPRGIRSCINALLVTAHALSRLPAEGRLAAASGLLMPAVSRPR